MFVLSACGGGGSELSMLLNSSETVKPVISHEVVPQNSIAHIDKYVFDIPSNTLAAPKPLAGKWDIALRHMGSDAAKYNISSDYSNLTGYTPPSESVTWQVGNNRGLVFQNYKDYFGSYIDTAKFNFEAVQGGGPHSILEYSPTTPIPMIQDNIGLTFKFYAKIPHFAQSGGGVAQICLIGYMVDGNNNSFAFVIPIFDNRGIVYTPTVANDGSVAFVSAPFGTNKYFTANSKSGTYTGNTFTNDTYYEGTITKQNLLNIIVDLQNYQQGPKFNNNISSDIGSYKLVLFGVIHEMSIMNDPTKSVSSGFSMHGLSIDR
jgi:hypothetical protein